MNLQECKNHLAQQYGYKEWNEAIIKAPSVAARMVDEVAKLYASEMVKEALRLVPGLPITESACGNQSECYCMGICSSPSIGISSRALASLETEILNQIQKEI